MLFYKSTNEIRKKKNKKQNRFNFNKNKISQMSIKSVLSQPFYVVDIQNGTASMKELHDDEVLDIGSTESNHILSIALDKPILSILKKTQMNDALERLHSRYCITYPNFRFGFIYNNIACKVGMFSQNCFTNHWFISAGGIFSQTMHPHDKLEWLFKGTAMWFSFFYPFNLKVLHDSLLYLAGSFRKLAIFWDHPKTNPALTDQQRFSTFFRLKYGAELYAKRFENLYYGFSVWIFKHYMYRHAHGWRVLPINYKAIYDFFYIMLLEVVFERKRDLTEFMTNKEKLTEEFKGRLLSFPRPSYQINHELDSSQYDIEYCKKQQIFLDAQIVGFKSFILKHALPAHQRGEFIKHKSEDHLLNAIGYRKHNREYGKEFDWMTSSGESYFKENPTKMTRDMECIVYYDPNVLADIKDGKAPLPSRDFCIFGSAKYQQ